MKRNRQRVAILRRPNGTALSNRWLAQINFGQPIATITKQSALKCGGETMNTFFWEITGVQRHFVVDIPVRGVTEKSIVVASVSEVTIPQGSPVGSAKNDPFLGDANSIYIQNIVPLTNGTVRVAVETNWSAGPINIRISGAVLGEV